jgi:hypothetical protein
MKKSILFLLVAGLLLAFSPDTQARRADDSQVQLKSVVNEVDQKIQEIFAYSFAVNSLYLLPVPDCTDWTPNLATTNNTVDQKRSCFTYVGGWVMVTCYQKNCAACEQYVVTCSDGGGGQP